MKKRASIAIMLLIIVSIVIFFSGCERLGISLIGKATEAIAEPALPEQESGIPAEMGPFVCCKGKVCMIKSGDGCISGYSPYEGYDTCSALENGKTINPCQQKVEDEQPQEQPGDSAVGTTQPTTTPTDAQNTPADTQAPADTQDTPQDPLQPGEPISGEEPPPPDETTTSPPPPAEPPPAERCRDQSGDCYPQCPIGYNHLSGYDHTCGEGWKCCKSK